MRILGLGEGIHLLKIKFTQLGSRGAGAHPDLGRRGFTLGNLDDHILLS